MSTLSLSPRLLIAPRSAAGLLALLIAAALAWAYLPARFRPLAVLDVRDRPVPFVTATKIARTAENRGYCEAALATSGLRVSYVPVLASTNGRCTVNDAIRVERSNALFSAGFNATCPLTVALALWIRHDVQPAARRELGAEVVRVDHLGSFACRAVRGGQERESRPLSEHAAANAIDITGFVLNDGRVVTVREHWLDQGNGEHARFLHAARDGACRYFGAVLGPDYNLAHHDHFHLDRGRWRICR